MRLEGVFAIEDREAVGVGAFAGLKDGGREVEGCRVGGSELVGGAGVDRRSMREEEAEDLVANFAGEVEEGEGHFWQAPGGGGGWWCPWKLEGLLGAGEMRERIAVPDLRGR